MYPIFEPSSSTPHTSVSPPATLSSELLKGRIRTVTVIFSVLEADVLFELPVVVVVAVMLGEVGVGPTAPLRLGETGPGGTEEASPAVAIVEECSFVVVVDGNTDFVVVAVNVGVADAALDEFLRIAAMPVAPGRGSWL